MITSQGISLTSYRDTAINYHTKIVESSHIPDNQVMLSQQEEDEEDEKSHKEPE